ncbi:hypothetical protein PT974_12168 [Cladobotryum mycophilum]|uniref:Uncharacterized protein n=1 Tax=Cladobotryum mycophilum TaxID=491253 RepID=A0ABR0S787_9HYPO
MTGQDILLRFGEVMEYFERHSSESDDIFMTFLGYDGALVFFFRLISLFAIKTKSLDDVPQEIRWIKNISSIATTENIATSNQATIPESAATPDNTTISEHAATPDNTTTLDNTTISEHAATPDNTTTLDNTTISEHAATPENTTISEHAATPTGFENISSQFPQWLHDPTSFWEYSSESRQGLERQSLHTFLKDTSNKLRDLTIGKLHYRFMSLLAYRRVARSRDMQRFTDASIGEVLIEHGVPTKDIPRYKKIIIGGRKRMLFCYQVQHGSNHTDTKALFKLNLDQLLSVDIDYGPMFDVCIEDTIWDTSSGHARQRFHFWAEKVKEKINTWSESSGARATAATLLGFRDTLIWTEGFFALEHPSVNKFQRKRRCTSQSGVTPGHKRPRTLASNHILQSLPLESASSISGPLHQIAKPQGADVGHSLSLAQGFQHGDCNEFGATDHSALDTLATAASVTRQVNSEVNIVDLNTMPSDWDGRLEATDYNGGADMATFDPDTVQPNWSGGLEATGYSGGADMATFDPDTVQPNWSGGLEATGYSGGADMATFDPDTVQPNWSGGLEATGYSGGADMATFNPDTVQPNWGGLEATNYQVFTNQNQL